ncbi:MAG: GIY-YIG nuclease family protein [Candidatus Curtissbacteria bacterium]
MYYTYVLESLKDHKRYIGSSSDWEKRLTMHNNGQVFSTKSRKPFKLIYLEEYETQVEARWREKSFKRSHDLLNRAMLRAAEYGRRPRGPLARREGSVG